MKVLQVAKKFTSRWPRKVQCRSCGSRLLLEFGDLFNWRNGSGSEFACPVCGEYQGYDQYLTSDEQWAVFHKSDDAPCEEPAP